MFLSAQLTAKIFVQYHLIPPKIQSRVPDIRTSLVTSYIVKAENSGVPKLLFLALQFTVDNIESENCKKYHRFMVD